VEKMKEKKKETNNRIPFFAHPGCHDSQAALLSGPHRLADQISERDLFPKLMRLLEILGRL
jgi:hypothetical protein